MGEFKFSCPRCGQHIVANEQWGGQQIPCPACQQPLVVPQTNPAPSTASNVAPPLPPPGSQLRFSKPPSKPAPPRPLPFQKVVTPRKPEKKSGAMKWVGIGAAIVVLGVGGYFGYGVVSKWQDSLNTKRRQMEKESDGGQVGHIAKVYSVLDQTDPNKFSRLPQPEADVPPPRSRSNSGGQSVQDQNLPVIPADWTMDVNAAQVPEGRVNGKISGTDFIMDDARMALIGTAYVLSLRQGAGTSPDREMVVFLRLKPGETPAGQSWTISEDMKGASVPQVAKLWKSNPAYAPTQKTYSTGYVMKLELGQASDGIIPGKIYLALPDEEHSVAAGIFKVEASLPTMSRTTTRTPVAGGVTPEERNGIVY